MVCEVVLHFATTVGLVLVSKRAEAVPVSCFFWGIAGVLWGATQFVRVSVGADESRMLVERVSSARRFVEG